MTKSTPSTNGTLQVKQEPPSTPQKAPVTNSIKVKKEKAPVDKPVTASPAATAAAPVKKEPLVTPPKPEVQQKTPKKKEEKDKTSTKVAMAFYGSYCCFIMLGVTVVLLVS